MFFFNYETLKDAEFSRQKGVHVQAWIFLGLYKDVLFFNQLWPNCDPVYKTHCSPNRAPIFVTHI